MSDPHEDLSLSEVAGRLDAAKEELEEAQEAAADIPRIERRIDELTRSIFRRIGTTPPAETQPNTPEQGEALPDSLTSETVEAAIESVEAAARKDIDALRASVWTSKPEDFPAQNLPNGSTEQPD